MTESVFALSGADRKALLENRYWYDKDAIVCAPSTNGNGPAISTEKGVFVIGDSLTYGMVKAGGLLDKLEATGANVSTAFSVTDKAGPGLLGRVQGKSVDATGGITIGGTSAWIDSDSLGISDSTTGKIVIALGTNAKAETGNAATATNESVATAQLAAMKDLVGKIRGMNASARIYWLNTYFTETSYGDYQSVNQTLSQITTIDSNSQVIDIAAAVAGDNTLAPDGGDNVHYSPAGYAKRAEWLVSQLGLGTQSGGTPTASGNEALLSITFPNFPDEAAIAKGIEDTVAKYAPDSPWLDIPNLGQFMIAQAKQYNVNPLFIMSTGGVESAFGTSGRGVSHNNAFGWDKGNKDFASWADGITQFAGFIRDALDGKKHPNYAKARTIYEYSSVHQTGGIYYPGNNKEINGAGPDFPIQDTRESGGMGVEVSWESPYNPLAYYKLNIKFINNATGMNFPNDNPTMPGTYVQTQPGTCGTAGSNALPAGAGGYDLPKEGSNPLVYYSQLKSGNDASVQGYFGDKAYGTKSIEECGCGPTSIAMIVSTLTTTKYDPEAVAKWASDNGYQNASCGSQWFWNEAKAKEYFKINVTAISGGATQIANSLTSQGNGSATSRNKLVLASVNNFPLPGISAGHITVIRKYDNGKFYFADPYSTGWTAVPDVSRRAYTSEEVSSMINQAWEITAQ
jgi:lysophospholipase L1-like esterase